MIKPSKKLPRAVSTFERFINGNYIYVDKTDLIAKLLLDDPGPYLLTRPRLFGKTTIVNTLRELFEHGLEKFDGLKISKYTEQELNIDKRYKVLHLSFGTFRYDYENKTINDFYADDVREFFESINIHVDESYSYLPLVFEDGLTKLNEQIVLLIDEYDSFLTAVLDDEETFHQRLVLLKTFFRVIKEYSDKFRFVYITGITRFAVSALDTLYDLNLDRRFATIAGYTQEELEHYFTEYIDQAVEILNTEKKYSLYDRDKIIELLKEHYDGYSFDITASCRVYNPWSIIYFFLNPCLGFKDYWIETGPAYPSYLIEYLNGLLKEDANKAIDLNQSFYKAILGLTSDFAKDPETQDELCAILYQTGYYTIKEIHPKSKRIKIGIPNGEVKNCFENNILKLLLCGKLRCKFYGSYKDIVVEELQSKSLDKLQATITKILKSMSFEFLHQFNKSSFSILLSLVSALLGVKAPREESRALGEADLVLTTDKYMYVIAIEVASSKDEIERKTHEARNLLKCHQFTLLHTDREVEPLVMVILNEVKVADSQAKPTVAVLEQIDAHDNIDARYHNVLLTN